jgi:hypothetical protein
MKALDITAAIIFPVAILFIITQIFVPYVNEQDAFRHAVWSCQDEIGDRTQAGWDFCVESLQATDHIEDGC